MGTHVCEAWTVSLSISRGGGGRRWKIIAIRRQDELAFLFPWSNFSCKRILKNWTTWGEEECLAGHCLEGMEQTVGRYASILQGGRTP